MDIITDEERRPVIQPQSIQEVMKDVVVYVEIRSGNDNRSAGIKRVISQLGAKINNTLLRYLLKYFNNFICQSYNETIFFFFVFIKTSK